MELTSSLAAHQCLRAQFNSDAEEMWIIALNRQLHIIEMKMIFRGGVDSCPCHPREIFRFLFLANASFFIMSHNHPMGQELPSEEDIRLTRQIMKLSKLCQIPLLDHVILSKKNYFSFADHGFIKGKYHRNSTGFPRTDRPAL